MIKAVKGFEGLYCIDENGTICSLVSTASRRKGIIKPFMNNSGYLRVRIHDSNGKPKTFYVHRLVAETFIPNPENLLIVNHIDANKENNKISNLEWCTQKENIKHSKEMGLQKRSVPTTVTNDKGESFIFSSIKNASLYIFNNHWQLAYARRSTKRNEFSYHGYLVKVGDAK